MSQRSLRSSARRRGEAKPLSNKNNTSGSRGGDGSATKLTRPSVAAVRKERPSPVGRNRDSGKTNGEKKKLQELLVRQQHMHTKATREKDAQIEQLKRKLASAESKLEKSAEMENQWKVKYMELEKSKQEEYKAIVTSQMERGKRLQKELSEAENRLNRANKLLEKCGIDPITQENLATYAEDEQRRIKELKDLDEWVEEMKSSQAADLEAMQEIVVSMTGLNELLVKEIEEVEQLSFDTNEGLPGRPEETMAETAEIAGREVEQCNPDLKLEVVAPLVGMQSGLHSPVVCTPIAEAVTGSFDLSCEEAEDGCGMEKPKEAKDSPDSPIESDDSLLFDEDEDSLNTSAVILGEDIDAQLQNVLDDAEMGE